MPKEYEQIRDKLAKGAKKNSPVYNKAQSEAAAIYVGQGKTKEERSSRAKNLTGDKPVTPHAKMRQMVDQLNKQKAANPATGGDGRMMQEVMNTSAIAKGQARDRSKKQRPPKTMPLREVMKKKC